MSIYDVPKNSISIIKSEFGLKIALASLKSDKKCIFHHEAFKTWIEDVYGPENLENTCFSSFQNEIQPSCDVKDVIFADFDLFLEIFGAQKAFGVLNRLKKNKRIFVICPPEVDNRWESIASSVFTISKTEDLMKFDCQAVIFDKKGKISTLTSQIVLQPDGKPIFKKIVQKEAENVQNPPEILENLGKSSLELPFFAARQEDGVAIRDSTNRKIRVGGQIIYEPDRDDDLDDSDPDDDLSI